MGSDNVQVGPFKSVPLCWLCAIVLRSGAKK